MTQFDELRNGLLSAHSEMLSLPNSVQARWNTIWMMLVGCDYLLEKAEFYVESVTIDYARAMQFALELLKRQTPPENEWRIVGSHPWPAGFYLVSAEHRLANSIERLTQVFVGAKLDTISSLGKIYSRCGELAQRCPYCADSSTYITDVHPADLILKEFSEGYGNVVPKSPLAKVYKRVNEIKHGITKLPKVQRLIADESTEERRNELLIALRDMVTLIRKLAGHRGHCVGSSTMEPLT